VVPINIPPLRERKQDIPYLANHFVEKLAPIRAAGWIPSPTRPWTSSWRTTAGNVRELENVIERSLVMCTGRELARGHPHRKRARPARKTRRISCRRG